MDLRELLFDLHIKVHQVHLKIQRRAKYVNEMANIMTELTLQTTAHVVTFHKCASNWFRRLFRKAAQRRGVSVEVSSPNLSGINKSVDRGSAHTLWMHRIASEQRVMEFATEKAPIVLCIRDPKDLVVSQYFSWKKSHMTNTPTILETRERLEALSMYDGLKLLIEEDLIPFCKVSRSWSSSIASGQTTVLKYEDMLEQFHESLSPALDRLGLSLGPKQLRDLKQEYAFSRMTKRAAKRGLEVNHYRKGKAGDWRNHFDDELSTLFNSRYGDVCKMFGYDQA